MHSASNPLVARPLRPNRRRSWQPPAPDRLHDPEQQHYALHVEGPPPQAAAAAAGVASRSRPAHLDGVEEVGHDRLARQRRGGGGGGRAGVGIGAEGDGQVPRGLERAGEEGAAEQLYDGRRADGALHLPGAVGRRVGGWPAGRRGGPLETLYPSMGTDPWVGVLLPVAAFVCT